MVLWIVLNDEAIIQKIPRVTLFAIRVKDLNALRNVLKSLYHEAFYLVNIIP